jgi:type II secretory pathway pseudopilin PulG
MDQLITVIILGLLAPFAAFTLRSYMVKAEQKKSSTSDTQRLETIIAAILDRSVTFDQQRKTVKELAICYREELKDGDKENGQDNVIQFFDHRSNQDKIRKI